MSNPVENNAVWNIQWTLTAWALAFTLKSKWGLFPPTFPYPVDIKQIDGNWVIEFHEIVSVTNRVWNNFTIVRAAENVPADDSAETQTATAFEFKDNSIVTLTKTAQDFKDIDDAIDLKLDTQDYLEWKKVFQSSSTWTDAYAVTITWINSYVNGATYRIQADVANTWVSTLEINALWPKALKKNQWTEDLVTWDIEADGIVIVVYNSTLDVFQFSWQIAAIIIPTSLNTQISLFAWETIDLWVAVYQDKATWKLLETDASDVNAIQFIWFANASWNLDDNVIVTISGVDWNQSWLSVWFDYFLQDIPVINSASIIQNLWTETGNPDSSVWMLTVWNTHKQGQDVITNAFDGFLRSITVDLLRVNTPPSNIQCKVFEVDKTTLLWIATNVFIPWDLTASYTSKTFNFDDIVIPKGSVIFIEFSVTWAKNDSQFYRVAYQNADVISWSHYFETGSWSWTTSSWNDTKYNIQLWITSSDGWIIGITPWTNNVKVWRAISATDLLINPGWF